jgi:2-dehydro-3-deoxyphosphogalactonate aldolase
MSLRRYLSEMPLVAILRGLKPEEAPDAFAVLVEAGFRVIEVPLNSPRPIETIAYMSEHAGAGLLIGAGTVLSVEEVLPAAQAGARLMVAPNCDPAVIAAAEAHRMATLPGVATPSEAFAAIKAGADGLKLFPGELLPPAALKAWRAVLPAGTLMLPVGGITLANMADYVAAGAGGFGIGSALYKPGMAASALEGRARAFVKRCRELFPAIPGA